MAKIKLRNWDITEHLENEEDIALYLSSVFEDGDPALIKQAIKDVIKSRNITELAKQMNISRRGLYKMLSPEGNLSFINMQNLLKNIGVSFSIIPTESKDYIRQR